MTAPLNGRPATARRRTIAAARRRAEHRRQWAEIDARQRALSGYISAALGSGLLGIEPADRPVYDSKRRRWWVR